MSWTNERGNERLAQLVADTRKLSGRRILELSKADAHVNRCETCGGWRSGVCQTCD